MSWNAGHLLKSGQYEVIRLIGSGGFGMTYLAKDLNLDRQVVIKRPNLSFEADRDYDKFLRRFKREGQVLAQLQIPNIVRVIEFTEVEGMPCLVMDFVAGETLNECIRRRKFIPEDEAWLMFKKLASAVEALHQQGIIHCDIHPGNIIVQLNSEPVLIDFGSTKLLHPTTWTVTTTVNKDFGPYEQMAESEENTRGPQLAWDIYSLAANMFFAVTGQKPKSAISRKLYGDDLRAPKKLKPELSDQLNQMILKGMSLEEQDRPNSIMAWVRLLDIKSSPPRKRRQKGFLVKNVVIMWFVLASIWHNIVTTLLKLSDALQAIIILHSKLLNVLSEPLLQCGLFLVLGNSLNGMVIGSFTWGLTDKLPWISGLAGTLVWSGFGVFEKDALIGLVLIFSGLLFWTLTFFLVKAGTGTLSWAGAFIGITLVVYLSDRFGKMKDVEVLVTCAILIMCGSFLLSEFFGYITGVPLFRDIKYELFAGASATSLFLGFTTSSSELYKKYGYINSVLIYTTYLLIGLASGGILGSWLKAAGILKLP